MNASTTHQPKSWTTHIFAYAAITLGAFLAAIAIDVFFFPNKLIDGGIVGIAMIGTYLLGKAYFAPFLILFNLPFMFLAYKFIGRAFVLHMIYALATFSIFGILIREFTSWEFHGQSIEYIVIGGAILGMGLGLIIRYGGCTDGTEILGIIINRKTGITVGQVVLFSNIFIFAAAGIAFQDWHPPLLSLIAYMVVIKVMDSVIVGLDETKSVLIISAKSEEISQAIIHELGLGLTIMYGRGGYSGDEREILYVIVERLQLADLKELVHSIDSQAFIAIENLHEVANGNQGAPTRSNQGQLIKILGNLIGLGKS